MEPKETELTPMDSDPRQQPQPQKQEHLFSIRFLLFVVCIAVAAAVLLTFTLTSALQRKQYTEQLLAQQEIIEQLSGSGGSVGQNLQLLDAVIQLYSYYADSMDSKAMLEAAFKAYVAASGDRYAQYYTQEEYQAIVAENNGDYCGIGVTVTNTTVDVNGQEYKVFRVLEIYEDSSALDAGIAVGDYIYAVERDGVFETINAIGYDQALAAVRGEEGTTVGLKVLREEEGAFSYLDFSVTRRQFETLSMRYKLFQDNAEIGIVSISGFDLTTPHQFKDAVNALLAQGVKHFVFDVRNNPGGDLQSIKAVLSYFLQEGDMVLSAIDRDGNVAATYTVEETSLTGDYAGCSVAREEIGMYADLDMVVLCNENTASAAEVFTATMRDYGLAEIVGMTTFGKGIMQTTRPIRFNDELVGYIKLTTYAYVTKCGESYHDVGIAPDVGVDLSEEAKKQPLSLLPQSMDQQLQTAVTLFK